MDTMMGYSFAELEVLLREVYAPFVGQPLRPEMKEEITSRLEAALRTCGVGGAVRLEQVDHLSPGTFKVLVDFDEPPRPPYYPHITGNQLEFAWKE